tara:strand:- start:365 stop:643 length:279 start_codon:yes stop_codon:yes gene_type:complete
MLQKIKDYLQEDADNTELDENTMEGAEEGILVGRKELAESLLNQINKWEAEEEQGTVYTGDAPSTEASFYKKSEVEDLNNQSYSEGERYDNE